MKFDADIAVVGGGPAGLAASIEAARRGFEVLLFEPRDSPIDKACGEGLMPGALTALDALGVGALDGAPFVGVTYRDGRDAELVAHGSFPGRHGIGVRRTTLHRAMTDRLHVFDVERVDERVDGIELDAEGVTLSTGHRVRWLIGADGLHSRIRRELGLDTGAAGSRYGIRRHYEIAPWSDRVEVYWSERGEAYVTPLGENLIGVAMLFEPPGRFDELLSAFPVLCDRLAGASSASDDRGAGAFGTRSATGRGRALLVGDAAGYVDALTGEGVSLGVVTATAAVTSIVERRPEAYARRHRRLTRRWTWTTRALLALTRPRSVHRPLIRLLRAQPKVFDTVLAILAGEDNSGPTRSAPDAVRWKSA